MPKPLPLATLKPNKTQVTTPKVGIVLGENVVWNPLELPNSHVVLIGASGSGKTQTLKALGYELPTLIPHIKLVIIDFHGDQELPGEVRYELSQESPHGINPLTLDLCPKGGGPALQSIAVAQTLKKALTMGANQEGLIVDIFRSCYQHKGIISSPSTWKQQPPTFADVENEIEVRVEDGCKESQKLALKLASTFQYGIFSKQQPAISSAEVTRFDLSALAKVPGLAAIAAESIVKQLLDSHRLMGETSNKSPRTFLLIDEAKEVKNSSSLKLVLGDGRKFGLSCIQASQSDKQINDEALINSATKVVLSVDQTEVARVSRRFRFADKLVAQLQPLEALVRFGTEGHKCKIKPFFERLT